VRRAWTLVSIAVVVVALGACGSGDEQPAATGDSGAADATGNAEAITTGSALAQIRGHHAVAVELYRGGDTQGALVHAGHPIEEIMASVTPEVDEHGGDADALEAAVVEVQDLVAAEAPIEDLEAAVERAASTTEDATAAVAGDSATSPEYVGSVTADLLATAAHEYEEAVAGGGGVKLLVEYQDGYAFVGIADDLYAEVESDVQAAAAKEAEEIDDAFEVLHAALPSAEPPKVLASALDVEAAAGLIGHELEETVSAQLLAEQDPHEIGEEIETLLEEIVTTYREGDADAAAELAAEAYLENYEVIEAEVIEQAPDVNAELEPLLGAELRRRIQEGAPVSEIEDMVQRAEQLLADALEALEHES
jgi:hypothetical protein